MQAALHLPQLDLTGEPVTGHRLRAATEAARDRGFVAISANDHFHFPAPWFDGLTALAAVAEHAGGMELATTVALPALRGPVPLAAALHAVAALCDGRLTAGVGPGSSAADYEAVGVDFAERWPRFEDAVRTLRGLVGADTPLPTARRTTIPVWIGSWGSAAGLRRVGRLGDGWFASAYNTTPERFAAALDTLGRDFPNALVTMWTWVTEDPDEARRMLADVLAPVTRRRPEELRGRVCVGSAEECARLLDRFAAAGCRRVHFWPLGDERRQVELLATRVLPRLSS